MEITSFSAVELTGGNERRVSINKFTNTAFVPQANFVYIAICNNGRDKNKVLRALVCTVTQADNQITVSDDYDLFIGNIASAQQGDINLKLNIKNSLSVLTVGVPESPGANFPIVTESLPVVFALN